MGAMVMNKHDEITENELLQHELKGRPGQLIYGVTVILGSLIFSILYFGFKVNWIISLIAGGLIGFIFGFMAYKNVEKNSRK